MAKLVSVAICERAVIDKYTNNASLHHVIDQFQVSPELPDDGTAVIGDSGRRGLCAFVALWIRSDIATAEEPFMVRFEVAAPSRAVVLQSEAFEIDLAGFKRFRIITRVQAIPYFGQGLYEVRVSRQSESGKWRRVRDAFAPLEFVVDPTLRVESPEDDAG